MSDDLVLQLKGISKSFGGVSVLSGVDLSLRRGEVHCIVGENGAGKSTLMKIITGAYPKDSGEIYLRGQRIEIRDVHHARELGISMIYQETNLVPTLSVVENIFLGNEIASGPLGRMDWEAMTARTKEVLADLRVDLDPHAKVGSLSTAEQQMVEIAKALVLEKEILIMDEPTSSLTQRNVEELFRIIRQLKGKGVAVIYISHRLQELGQIADRVTVLRDGHLVGTFAASEIDIPHLIRLMVGRDLAEDRTNEVRHVATTPLLKVEGLTRSPKVKGVSFEVRPGEIVGFAGLVGAGRTELMRLIFGADLADSGAVYLEGKRLRLRAPSDAVRHGIGLLTEDRKGQGLVLGMPVRSNITLASLARLTTFGRVNQALERQIASEQVRALHIGTPSTEYVVSRLSGGNQQKVVVAKWLTTQCRVLIFDEPTRGIDVGARAEIYEIVHSLARQGVAIIVVSSDLPEVLRLSDRVMVMAEGRITGELSRDEATQERVMSLMLGGVGNVA